MAFEIADFVIATATVRDNEIDIPQRWDIKAIGIKNFKPSNIVPQTGVGVFIFETIEALDPSQTQVYADAQSVISPDRQPIGWKTNPFYIAQASLFLDTDNVWKILVQTWNVDLGGREDAAFYLLVTRMTGASAQTVKATPPLPRNNYDDF